MIAHVWCIDQVTQHHIRAIIYTDARTHTQHHICAIVYTDARTHIQHHICAIIYTDARTNIQHHICAIVCTDTCTHTQHHIRAIIYTDARTHIQHHICAIVYIENAHIHNIIYVLSFTLTPTHIHHQGMWELVWCFDDSLSLTHILLGSLHVWHRRRYMHTDAHT